MFKFLFTLLIFSFLILPKDIKAQNNDFQAGIYNIGIGSVLGAVGAVLHKKPEENFGKTLLKGIGQGALGGYLIFESKRLVRNFAETGSYNYVWPSKMINSAGASIIQNAATNRNFWERWHFIFGFNRFELKLKEEFRISYRVMPIALAGAISSLSTGKFNLDKSFKMGNFVFETSKIANERNAYGQIRTNSIIILDDYRGVLALPHELLHIYQFESYSGVNPTIKSTFDKVLSENKIKETYDKIFYTDFYYPMGSLLYFLANPSRDKQIEHNYFEREAEYYTKTPKRTRIIN